MTETYVRAREAILNQLLSFPTISNKDWQSCSFGGLQPVEGDLVSLQSAPPSKWQLSWFVKRDRPEGWACDRYLLQSIEDRSERWWSNVSFSIYKPTLSEGEYPKRFRWTDRQFAFNSRWHKVCSKLDNYTTRPVEASFRDGYCVVLSCYKRWTFDPSTNYSKAFQDWRKVTKKMMEDFYKEAVKAQETK